MQVFVCTNGRKNPNSKKYTESKKKKKKSKIITGRGALSHEAAGGFYFLTPLTVIAKAGRKDKLER